MKSTLIKDTTKEERIALIKEWLSEDDKRFTESFEKMIKMALSVS